MKRKVKFSKGTFRKNPEMVLSFYEKKISEFESEIESFTNRKHVLTVGLNGKTLSDIERLIVNSKYLAGEFTIDLDYNYVEMLKIIDEIERMDKTLATKYQYLKELKDEYSGVLQRIKSP